MISYEKMFKLLKEKGWNSTKIRDEGLIGQGSLTILRNRRGGLCDKTLDRICRELNCQPGDLMEYIPDEEA